MKPQTGLSRTTGHARLLWAEKLDIEMADPPEEGERARLDQMFGRYAGRLWTGHNNIHALTDDVEHVWQNEEAIRDLRFFVRVACPHPHLRSQRDPFSSAALKPGDGSASTVYFRQDW